MAAPGGLPAFIKGKDESAFIVHEPVEPEAELKRFRMGASLITPYELFYLRNNLVPRGVASRSDYRLRVEGVRRPGRLSLADLERLPRVVVPALLQCAGNGRAFHPHNPDGSPWQVGAAGLGFWGGVLVREVAKLVGGPLDSARFLTTRGSEDSANIDRVERSIPRGKALRDCLLALELNGAPIPLAQGGPVRLIVPGYYAINSVKYPRSLAFTARESQAPIMTEKYRIAPVGQAQRPSQPTCWAMNVKSWTTSPLTRDRVSAGPVEVLGVAFAGEDVVRRVEVTTDGGATWSNAELIGPDLGTAAWRQFRFRFRAQSGKEYTIASRATAANGASQPEQTRPNEGGYKSNGWREPAVRLRVG